MKLLKKSLLVISTLVMLMCAPVSAKTASSVKAVKVGKMFTIKDTSNVTSSKKKVAQTKQKNKNAYKISALKAGKSTLKVYGKNGRLSQKVYLLVYTDKTLNYDNSALSLSPGGTMKVQATVPSGCTVKYSSSDKSIAKVNTNGKITAVAYGSTTVKAQVYYKNTKIKTFKKPVLVSKSTAKTSSGTSSSTSSGSGKSSGSSSTASYYINGYADDLAVGGSYTMKCLREDGKSTSGDTFSWSVSDSNVFSLKTSGNSCTYTATGAGTATITCKVNGKTADSVKLTVVFTPHFTWEDYGDGRGLIKVYCEKSSDKVTYKCTSDEEFSTSSAQSYDSSQKTNAYVTSLKFTTRDLRHGDIYIYVNGNRINGDTYEKSYIAFNFPYTYYDGADYNEWKPQVEKKIWNSSMSTLDQIVALLEYLDDNAEYSIYSCNYVTFCPAVAERNGMSKPGGDCQAAAHLVKDFFEDLGYTCDIYYPYTNAAMYTHAVTKIYTGSRWYGVDAANETKYIYDENFNVVYSTLVGKTEYWN